MPILINKIKKILNSISKRPKNREIEFSQLKNIFLKKVELFFRELWFVLKKSDFSDKSAQLTYTSILSLVPLIAILFTFIHSLNGINSFFEKSLVPLILKHFGNEAGTKIANYLKLIIVNLELKELGLIAFGTFLVTVILLIIRIEDTFNQIMEFKIKMNLIQRLSKCWIIITITPFLFLLSSLKSDSFFKFIFFENYFILNSSFIDHIRTFVGLIFESIFFSLVYYTLPSSRMHIKSVIIGGVFATLSFESLQILNSFLTKRALTTESHLIYGSAPLIAVLFFVWMRIIWIIIMFGASVSIAFERIFFHKKSIFCCNKTTPLQSIEDCLTIYNSVSDKFKNTSSPASIETITKDCKIPKSIAIAWLGYLLQNKILSSYTTKNNEVLFLPSYRALKNEKNKEEFLKEVLFGNEKNATSKYNEVANILKNKFK